MGLLDELLGAFGGGAGSQGGGNPLLNIIMQMISGPNSGGLGGLLEIFAKSGMKDQFDSWVSTGGNMPVTPEQMRDVFGGKIGDIAKQLGVSEGEVAGGLADILPQVVDKMTPDGLMPSDDILIK